MATFVDDSDVLVKVKALLKKASSATIPSAISGNIAAYNVKAYNEIVAILKGRGFSDADFSGWDRGEEFNLDLACWWAITDAGVTESFDDKELAKLDRRADLKTCYVTSGAALKSPTPTVETTDYSTNKSYGNKFAFGTGLNYDNFKNKPDKYEPVRITEFED
jgi:hypothetical protein